MISYEKNLAELERRLSFDGLAASGLEKLSGSKPDGVVVFGMGGSGIPGLILRQIGREFGLKVPVVAVEDDALPALYFKRPLFIAVSFSGNTAETLSCLKSALASKKRAGLAAVTTGGKLRSLAVKNKIPLVTFSGQNLTPREASAIMFYGIIEVLKSVFPLHLLSSPKLLSPNRLKSLGKKLAGAAKGRNVLIYTDTDFSHLGYIWETNLNETAKIAAFTDVYPELNHNEIAGFEKKSGAWAIFWLTDKPDKTRDKKIRILNDILGKKGVKSVRIPLPGKNKREKTWNGWALSHWTSLALAKLNKVDPRKTRIIDELKRRVK